METMCSPVDRVIKCLGGITKTAAALGVSNPSVIGNWRLRRRIPAERVLDIERITGISRHELRPDIFGPAREKEPTQ